ncbi:unnamed protein product [Sphenostylis stenocarpa]|uniref:Uncharacterized protein n=1 Tax=Sphenostylis stenocarpa TaxID=92480 RepID=A0AA86RY51_9FABA|nr:unnamed protein product [Sphenostylis stenocarpa]
MSASNQSWQHFQAEHLPNTLSAIPHHSHVLKSLNPLNPSICKTIQLNPTAYLPQKTRKNHDSLLKTLVYQNQTSRSNPTNPASHIKRNSKKLNVFFCMNRRKKEKMDMRMIECTVQSLNLFGPVLDNEIAKAPTTTATRAISSEGSVTHNTIHDFQFDAPNNASPLALIHALYTLPLLENVV